MDTCTHALLAAAAVYAATPSRSRLRTRDRLAIGAAAGAFPDIDFLAFPIDPLAFLADWHQGPTHSLVLLPLWALALGLAYVALTRRREDWIEAAIAAGIGIGAHIAADLITVYRTAVLFPLSDVRVSLGTTFVIDPWFTVIVLGSLVWGLWSRRRLPVALGLATLSLYIAGEWLLRDRALEAGRTSLAAHGLAQGRLAAIPQPFSPFSWKLIDTHGTFHREAYLSLSGGAPQLPFALPVIGRSSEHAYRSPAGLDWVTRQRLGDLPHLHAVVEQRWLDPRFAPFRRFATHPAVSRIDVEPPGICIWFTDLRYDLPGLPDTFRYGFCREAETAPWQLFRIRYFSRNERQRLR